MKKFLIGFALGAFFAKPFFDCNGKALENHYADPDVHIYTEVPR